MLKQLLNVVLLLGMLLNNLICWAIDYPQVEYIAGYPGWHHALLGTLSLSEEGVVFLPNVKSRSDNTIPNYTPQFYLPYEQIRGYRYESRGIEKSKHPFAIAGPEPWLLATTLGASVLANAAMRPSKHEVNYIYVQFTDKTDRDYEVTFKVPTQTVQARLMREVQTMMRNQQQVVIRQQQEAVSHNRQTLFAGPVDPNATSQTFPASSAPAIGGDQPFPENHSATTDNPLQLRSIFGETNLYRP